MYDDEKNNQFPQKQTDDEAEDIIETNEHQEEMQQERPISQNIYQNTETVSGNESKNQYDGWQSSQGSNSSPYGTGSYQNRQTTGQQYSAYNAHVYQEPRNKPTKKGHPSLFKKIAGITGAALLFGSVAGCAMAGINLITGKFAVGMYPTISQTETVVQPTTPVDSASAESLVPVGTYTDVSAIVERAMPSVVAITSTVIYQGNNWFYGDQTYEVPGSGSGIIIGQNDSELLVVTNNHVVEGSSTLNVTFIDNTSVDAAIKGTDSESDLAVIAVPLASIPAETMGQIQVATMGDSDNMKVGQGVIAIGNALGYGQSVTVGYISALNREVTTQESDSSRTTRTLLQTDAAINPGNSGGALINMQGELIGINAAKYTSTDVEGMGYAIPISFAQDIIDDLMGRRTKAETVAEEKQGYLGIQGNDIDVNMATGFGMPQGVYVYRILEEGAAAKSDLREKDIITKFDGETVKNMSDLSTLLTYYEGGTTVDLTVQSLENGAYAERIVSLTLGYRPAPAQQQ